MAGPEKTDTERAAQEAERLAAAQAAMIAATEEAKASRLPSAVRALEVLNGNAMAAAMSALTEAVAANVDDLPRALGQQASEGTKQMLQRILNSFEGAQRDAQARIAALQPASAVPPAAPEAEA
ncbi:MAG: hypothetical protein AB1448_05180 [Pseudomonadota bacterium]